eukprot:gene24602-10220_t
MLVQKSHKASSIVSVAALPEDRKRPRLSAQRLTRYGCFSRNSFNPTSSGKFSSASFSRADSSSRSNSSSSSPATSLTRSSSSVTNSLSPKASGKFGSGNSLSRATSLGLSASGSPDVGALETKEASLRWYERPSAFVEAETQKQIEQASKVGARQGKWTCVLFYARWCSLCQTALPALESIAHDKLFCSRFQFFKARIDCGDLAYPIIKSKSIRGLPYLCIYGPDGKVAAGMSTTFAEINDVRSKLMKLVDSEEMAAAEALAVSALLDLTDTAKEWLGHFMHVFPSAALAALTVATAAVLSLDDFDVLYSGFYFGPSMETLGAEVMSNDSIHYMKVLDIDKSSVDIE